MSGRKMLERPDMDTFAKRARGAFLGLLAADREWHPRPGPPGYPVELALVAANAILYGITRGEYRGIMGDWDGYTWMAFRHLHAAQGGARAQRREDEKLLEVSWVANEAAMRGGVHEELETVGAVMELAAMEGAGRSNNASERPESLLQALPAGIIGPVVGWEAGQSGAQVAALTRPGAAARVAAAYLGEVAGRLAAGMCAEVPGAIRAAGRAATMAVPGWLGAPETEEGREEMESARRLRQYLTKGRRIPSGNGALETVAFAVRTLREEVADWQDAMRLARRWQVNPLAAAWLVGALEGLRRGEAFVVGAVAEDDPAGRIAKILGTDFAEGWRVCHSFGPADTPEERRWFEMYVMANGARAGETKAKE